MDQHRRRELLSALVAAVVTDVGPGWSDGRRPSAPASRATMKRCVAPVSRRTVMRRGPRGVARKPDKRGLKAGLPLCHVWKASESTAGHGRRQSTHLPTHLPDRRPGPRPFRWRVPRARAQHGTPRVSLHVWRPVCSSPRSRVQSLSRGRLGRSEG